MAKRQRNPKKPERDIEPVPPGATKEASDRTPRPGGISSTPLDDRHAAGTPGGGTEAGGLAGTTHGGGDPDDVNLEELAGSGVTDRDEDEEGLAYGGPSGGAVGGTPAQGRSSGGRTRGGLRPGGDPPADRTVGAEPAGDLSPSGRPPSAKRLTLTTAFEPGQRIPPLYTADGKDLSPPLTWGDPPEGTETFALVCEDPDAPKKTWVHWVAFNIPAEARQIEEGLAPDARERGFAQGTNDFGSQGYGGPAPPPGKPHRYFFRLYALDTRLDLPPGADREQLFRAMQGHILGVGETMGTYAR